MIAVPATMAPHFFFSLVFVRIFVASFLSCAKFIADTDLEMNDYKYSVIDDDNSIVVNLIM